MKKLKRLSWDDYFIKLAQMVKTRSNCMRRQVGALLVKDKQIIASGYSGTPKGIKN
jgi:dCMP deaminase